MEKTRVEKFRDWINTARTGRIYIYHTGSLSVDRGTIVDYGDGSPPHFVPSGDIHELGTVALDAFEAHRVHLFQRKLHDNEYQYIAMKAGPGRTW